MLSVLHEVAYLLPWYFLLVVTFDLHSNHTRLIHNVLYVVSISANHFGCKSTKYENNPKLTPTQHNHHKCIHWWIWRLHSVRHSDSMSVLVTASKHASHLRMSVIKNISANCMVLYLYKILYTVYFTLSVTQFFRTILSAANHNKGKQKLGKYVD